MWPRGGPQPSAWNRHEAHAPLLPAETPKAKTGRSRCFRPFQAGHAGSIPVTRSKNERAGRRHDRRPVRLSCHSSARPFVRQHAIRPTETAVRQRRRRRPRPAVGSPRAGRARPRCSHSPSTPAFVTAARQIELKFVRRGVAPFGPTNTRPERPGSANRCRCQDSSATIASGTAYVAPSTGDVCEFVDSTRKWIRDPNRRGMP
jgi:hypothetical protein